jgi:hypothetical protein
MTDKPSIVLVHGAFAALCAPRASINELRYPATAFTGPQLGGDCADVGRWRVAEHLAGGQVDGLAGAIPHHGTASGAHILSAAGDRVADAAR